MKKVLRPFGYTVAQLEALLPKPGDCLWLTGCCHADNGSSMCDCHEPMWHQLTAAVRDARMALVAEAALIS